MDNCKIHKCPEFIELIEATGAIIVYLPPYSPQYNPVGALAGLLSPRLAD